MSPQMFDSRPKDREGEPVENLVEEAVGLTASSEAVSAGEGAGVRAEYGPRTDEEERRPRIYTVALASMATAVVEAVLLVAIVLYLIVG